MNGEIVLFEMSNYEKNDCNITRNSNHEEKTHQATADQVSCSPAGGVAVVLHGTDTLVSR